MPFEKNNKLGKSGRPKNSPNKATSEIRKAFQMLVNDNLQQLEIDLKALEPKDRIAAIVSLTKFIVPQLKQTEIELDYKEPPKIPIIQFYRTPEN